MLTEEATQQGDELLTTPAAGKFIATKPGTLQNWRSAGRGPAYVKLSPRRVLYRRSDLERWLQERTHTPGVCA